MRYDDFGSIPFPCTQSRLRREAEKIRDQRSDRAHAQRSAYRLRTLRAVRRALLRPRESDFDDTTAGQQAYLDALEEWEDMSPISGIFNSFSDAPGGAKEELREINYSIGAEYNYNQQFFLRAGYFHENEFKGNRQYFGFGAGFALNVVRLDASYMIATAQTSPLDQTLRFSLTFDMDGLKELLGKR